MKQTCRIFGSATVFAVVLGSTAKAQEVADTSGEPPAAQVAHQRGPNGVEPEVPSVAAVRAVLPDSPTPSIANAPFQRMDLEQAMGLALSRHPRLIAARHQTSSAEAHVGVARSRYYPQVHVWMQYLRGTENGNLAVFHSVPGVPRIGGSRRDGVSPYDSFNNYHAALTVHQLLHDFGRTQGAVAAQKTLVEAAKMNERLVEQAVLFGVTRAYYEVLAAREGARVAEEALMRTERLLELAAAGQEAGLRQPSEKARAEADVATAEVAKIEALAALDVARAQFINSLGLIDASFEPAGEEPAHPANMVEAEALAEALRNRPELKALDLQRRALTERMRSINAGHYPRIEAVGVLQSRGQFLGGEQFDYGANNWSAGLVVNVPVFQGYLITEQANAVQAEVQAIESGREAIRQAVVLEVKRALAQVRSADEAEHAALKAVEAAKIALDTSEGRYRTGLATLVEMTDAQSVYISVLSGAVRASYNRRFARAALDLATGSLGRRPPPEPPGGN
jgi:outer membrane protein